jgi:uncharacterized protein (TIGR00251 family)
MIRFAREAEVAEWLRESGESVLLRVKAMPNAGASSLVGIRNGELVLRLGAQPEKGKANRELLDFLGRELGTSRSSLRLVSGEAMRHKVVALPAALRPRLEAWAAVKG